LYPFSYPKIEMRHKCGQFYFLLHCYKNNKFQCRNQFIHFHFRIRIRKWVTNTFNSIFDSLIFIQTNISIPIFGSENGNEMLELPFLFKKRNRRVDNPFPFSNQKRKLPGIISVFIYENWNYINHKFQCRNQFIHFRFRIRIWKWFTSTFNSIFDSLICIKTTQFIAKLNLFISIFGSENGNE
jgi:hypothetical protein